MLRQPGNDPRLVVTPLGPLLVRGDFTSPFYNELNGYARGVELMVQRTGSGRGLTGWLAYAYGLDRDHDAITGESYWGDYDQRHTFNAYARYAVSDRTSLVAKLRMGSNFPIPGYYAERDDGSFRIGSERNTARLPLYARLDLRGDRTFTWTHRRVTAFVEVINTLNRENVRFVPPAVNTRVNAVAKPFEAMFPLVPSAGLLIEF